jgi:hypothetical protein
MGQEIEMQITYTYSFSDLLLGQLYFWPRIRAFRLIPITLILFIIYSLSRAEDQSSVQLISLLSLLLQRVFIGVVIVGTVLILGIRLYYTRNKRNNTLTQKITASESSFVIETNLIRVEHKWPSIKKIETTDKFVFIYIAKYAAYLIPTRIFSSSNSESFVKYIKHQWLQATGSESPKS